MADIAPAPVDDTPSITAEEIRQFLATTHFSG
jgi:hypothetical protein